MFTASSDTCRFSCFRGSNCVSIHQLSMLRFASFLALFWSGSRNATRCIPGFACNSTGLMQPVPCPFGYACPGGATSPIFCAVGTYALSASVECTVCPNRDAQTLAECFCSAGFYSDPASSTCLPCPPGQFCAGGGTFFACYVHCAE